MKKNLIIFNMVFYVTIWNFAEVLDLSWSSQFVSCLIAVTYQAQLDSLIGQNLIIEFYSFVVWVAAAMIQSQIKLLLSTLFIFFGRNCSQRFCGTSTNYVLINVLTTIVFKKRCVQWGGGSLSAFCFKKVPFFAIWTLP